MKRKVIKQGNGTLTITLPKRWTKDTRLTEDNEVEITINENNLIVNPVGTQEERSISVDAADFDRLAISKFLIACYEQGFDNITITFSKSKIKSWSHGEENIGDVIDFFVSRLIGFEVLSQTKNRFTIGNIAEKHVKFESILSRMFFLIEEYLRHLIESLESQSYDDLKDRELRHDTITKMISLSLRELYESVEFSKIESLNIASILNLLDKVTDFIRYSYKFTQLHNKKVSKDTIILAKKTLEYFDLYRSFFNKFSYEKINQLDDLRGNVKKHFIQNVKINSKESLIFSQFDALVATLHGAIKPRIAIEIEKNLS